MGGQARASISKTLSIKKRDNCSFGGGDIRALLNTTIYSKETSACQDIDLQNALFWTLLYVTGARPGEFTYSRGYHHEGHYLKVEVSYDQYAFFA